MFDTPIICVTILSIAYITKLTIFHIVDIKSKVEPVSDVLDRVEKLEKFQSEVKSKLNAITMGQAFKA
jgi:hypothetical protein